MNNFRFAAALLLPLAFPACVSHSPSRVSSMSTYEVCELQAMQGANMTEESRRLVRSELERRKQTCAPHQAAIRMQRDEELYDRTYRTQSP